MNAALTDRPLYHVDGVAPAWLTARFGDKVFPKGIHNVVVRRFQLELSNRHRVFVAGDEKHGGGEKVLASFAKTYLPCQPSIVHDGGSELSAMKLVSGVQADGLGNIKNAVVLGWYGENCNLAAGFSVGMRVGMREPGLPATVEKDADGWDAARARALDKTAATVSAAEADLAKAKQAAATAAVKNGILNDIETLDKFRFESNVLGHVFGKDKNGGTFEEYSAIFAANTHDSVSVVHLASPMMAQVTEFLEKHAWYREDTMDEHVTFMAWTDKSKPQRCMLPITHPSVLLLARVAQESGQTLVYRSSTFLDNIEYVMVEKQVLDNLKDALQPEMERLRAEKHLSNLENLTITADPIDPANRDKDWNLAVVISVVYAFVKLGDDQGAPLLTHWMAQDYVDKEMRDVDRASARPM